MTVGPHPDPHSLLAPYALDALDDTERAGFEAHLERCPTCTTELAGFLATAERLGSAEESAPPPQLRERLLAEVATTRQERSVVTSITSRSRLRQALPSMLAAASVLVAALAVGGYLAERDEAQDLRADSQRVTAVMAADDAETTSGQVSTGGSIRMITSPSHDAAVVVGTSLKPLDDEVYQLWAMHDGKPVSAGVLGPASGMLYVPSIEGADGFAVTVEPPGGSEEPTSVPVVTMPA